MDGEATDPILEGLLRAPTADDARDEIDRVILGVARPIVHAIVRATLRSGQGMSGPIDADDVEQTVLTSLTASLMRLRSLDPPSPIRSFPDYAAAVTYNTCHAALRLRAPGRARLRAHVRYVLTHSPALALVAAPAQRWLASLRSWTTDRPSGAADAIDAALARISRPPGWPRPGGPALARLIEAVLELTGGPCTLEALVDRLAACFGSGDADRSDSAREPEATTASPIEVLDYRERLVRLWTEIRALPPRQRAALLLNLRDDEGAGVIELIPATGGRDDGRDRRGARSVRDRAGGDLGNAAA